MRQDERINDELLVLHSQGGSAEAFELLLQRWQERLWRFAHRLTDDEQAAWDVLQETALVVSRKIRSLEDPAAFPAWAYQIAGNKSRDWIRRRQRGRRADEAYARRQHESDRHRQVVERSYANLKEALADMPGDDQAILSLRYEEEFNTDEISEILGIPSGTVKSRLHYARGRLRRLVKEE